MPIYEYSCDSCQAPAYIACGPANALKGRHDAGRQPCSKEGCRGVLRRVFSFSVAHAFEPHYNSSQGQWVPTRAALADNAKRASDAASERTGVEHNFVVHDVAGAKPEDFGAEA